MKTLHLATFCSIFAMGLGNGLGACNATVNCLKKPKDCVSLETDCDAVTMWSYDVASSKLHVNMTTKQKWVGFGQVKPNKYSKMHNLFGAVCIGLSNDTQFKLFNASGKSLPHFFDVPNNSEVTVTGKGNVGGMTSCSFSRGLGVGAEGAYLHPLNNTEYLAIMAVGTSLNGDLPTYHGYGNYVASEETVTWKPATPTSAPTTTKPKKTTTPPTQSSKTTKGSSSRVEKASTIAIVVCLAVMQLF